MAIDRRTVLKSALAAGLSSLLSGSAAAAAAPAYVSTCRRADGTFTLAALDGAGRVLFEVPMTGRGHDLAIAPDRKTIVAFARRPGRFAVVVDIAGRRIVNTLQSAPNRHFFGHGFFSADGRLLYATENAYDLETGVLGIYDVGAGYRRVGEVFTGGVGPHDALMMPDRRTIAIANGGILTHPDSGRRKLNLAVMQPSLNYLDSTTGELVDRMVLAADLHQMSIRHLAIDGSGAVWFGGQFEGPATDDVPLVGRHRPGGRPQLMAPGMKVMRGFRHYIGAVARNRVGTRIATTSPRGGVIAIWDAETGEVVKTMAAADVCGVAPASGNGFVATSGNGDMLRTDGSPALKQDLSWDNHLRAI